MKKTKILSFMAVLAVLVFILTGCSADVEETKEKSPNTEQTSTSTGTIEVPMKVVNDYSNVTMKELYVSSSGTDNWGDELLEGESITPGGSVDLSLTVDANNLEWDIYVVDEDGTTIEFRGLDISEVSENGGTITLTADDEGNPVATAE